MEHWRTIPGCDGLYQVSDLGRVKRLAYTYKRMHLGNVVDVPIPEKILGGTKLGAKGYCRVNLNGTFKQIHVLVAQAFISNPLNKPQVNHLDGNKTNNRADNLEWVTNQENRDHAVQMGLHANRQNGKIGKLTTEEVLEIQTLYSSGMYYKDIAAFYGVNWRTIHKLVKV